MKNTLKESLDIIAAIGQNSSYHSMARYEEPVHPDFKDLNIDELKIKNNKLTVVLDPSFPVSVENGFVRLEFTSRKNLVNFIHSTIDYLDYKSAELGKETFDKIFKDQVQLLASLKKKLEQIDEQRNHPYF